MRSLPKALLPWAEQLAALPSDLALTLLPWLQRIDAAIGEIAVGRPDDEGEPDGYDGLHTRGPYHRLLSSDWLLAEELPDEFMRRAAMGEHRFFRIARRMPQGERAIVALLDVGPDQLGSPRIGQLAALLVLARRAARAGGRLLWSHLHARSRGLHEGVGVEAIKAWQSGKSVQRPSEEDCARWTEVLDSERASADRWLIGAPRLAQHASAREHHQIALEAPVFAEPQKLVLSMRARSTRSFGRAYELPMPEPRAAVRLLRDPFEQAQAPPRATGRADRFDLASPPHLTADCRGVTLRLESGDVVTYPFASSANATPAKPRYFRAPPRHRVLAVTRAGRLMLAVTLRGNSVCLFGVGEEQAENGHKMARISFGSRAVAAVRLGDHHDNADEEVPLVGPLGALTARRIPGQSLALTVVRGGKVTELQPSTTGYNVIDHTGILAAAGGSLHQGCMFVRQASDHELEVRAQSGEAAWMRMRSSDAIAPSAVFLGHETLAACTAPHEYLVQHDSRDPVHMRAPSDFVVVGAMAGGLVCSIEEGRMLVLLRRDGMKTLARSSARIAQVSVGFLRPLVAFTNAGGGVAVVELGGEGVLMRLRVSGGS